MSKDIKIFVSHRIDLNSVTIDNPLYVPVYCGAVYKEASKRDPRIIGDDTGDNISEKRRSFCEYTVQYWAWKNVKAEYYGLCHYRRYLSFADRYFDYHEPHRFAVERNLNTPAAKKYELLNADKMRREIKKYDVITSVTYPVDKLPFYPKPRNERELWKNHPHFLVSEDDIDMLLSIVRKKFPKYYEKACELMESEYHRGFNCFIMRRKYFYSLCEFEFGVLFELESKMNVENYSGNRERVFGYLGEILYGIYMEWLKESLPKEKFCEKQIVLFNETGSNVLPSLVKEPNYKEKIYRRLFPNFYLIQHIIKQLEAHSKALSHIQRQIRDISLNTSKVEKRTFHMFNMEKWDYQMHSLPFHEIDKKRLSFWRNFPKASGDLRIVQRGNTYMLAEMLRMCNELDIKFWLHGGSLVGSLRHSGPVPWDDDIDVAMLRPDFERLRDYVKKTEPVYEIGEYYYCTLGCRSYRLKKNGEAGTLPFFVDIFLYDIYECQVSPLEDWRKLRLFHQGQANQMAAISREYDGVFNDEQLDEKPDIKRKMDALIDGYIERFKCNQGDYLLWGLDNNYENNTRYAWHNGRIFARKDIFPLQECRYEDLICYIPANFEKYCIAEYGIRYIDMPDVMGQAIHFEQYFKDIDLKKAYNELTGKEYVEDEQVIQVDEDIYGRFIFPWRAVWPDMKVLIYGAGVVGKTFLAQLKEHPCCEILAVIDRCPPPVDIGHPVITLSELDLYRGQYDMVLIAIENPAIAGSIKRDLLEAGVLENKIYWEDYRR